MRLACTPCSHPDVLLLQPAVHRDARGLFFENYHEAAFQEATGLAPRFVQDNFSRSAHAVLRGLHFQVPPQGKLVSVLAGSIFDVAVDLRPRSPRFGQFAAVQLDAQAGAQLWVPPGFAHGFLVLSDSADVLYKCTSLYAPGAETVLAWDDVDLAIEWPLANLRSSVQLSARDAAAKPWRDVAAQLSGGTPESPPA